MLGVTYLNYAGLAPLRLRSLARGLFPWEAAGNVLLPRFVARQQALREAVARWLGVTDRNVAFLTSTTTALRAVAESIDWQPGDVVLYPAGDFPANVFTWTDLARRGVRAEGVTDWRRPFPERTRLVAISSIDFASGDERPWRAVCARARAQGIWTCLDAIQSAGVKPCWSDDVDFWAAGTQKWLVSGLGLGLLVVHDRALAALEGPWRTYLGLTDPRRAASGPADSARRWELGWVTPGALERFAATLRAFQATGWEAISAAVRERRDRLHEALLGMGWRVVSSPVEWSGIVTIDPQPVSAAAIVEDGYRRRIVTAERAGWVRLSPHRTTSDRELERAVDWLWSVRAGRIALPAAEMARPAGSEAAS